jgi:hypothetical protein
VASGRELIRRYFRELLTAPSNLAVADEIFTDDVRFTNPVKASGVKGMLAAQRGPRRSDGLAFHGLVHALVRAVLLRVGRQNPLMLNAEPHPPPIHVRQPVNGHRGERDAVVGANRPGQAVGAKQSIEDGFDAPTLRLNKPWHATRYRVCRSATVSG